LGDGAVRPRAGVDQIRQCLEGALAVNWAATVAGVGQPTLYVRATDAYGPPGYPPLMSREQAERSAALFADCTLTEVGGNHMTGFFGDAAASVAGAICAFLQTDGRAPRGAGSTEGRVDATA